MAVSAKEIAELAGIVSGLLEHRQAYVETKRMEIIPYKPNPAPSEAEASCSTTLSQVSDAHKTEEPSMLLERTREKVREVMIEYYDELIRMYLYDLSGIVGRTAVIDEKGDIEFLSEEEVAD